MTKFALITKNHTVVTSKARSGGHRGEMDFKASPDPVPVTNAQLEALIAAGAAEEVPAPTQGKASGDASKPSGPAAGDAGAKK